MNSTAGLNIDDQDRVHDRIINQRGKAERQNLSSEYQSRLHNKIKAEKETRGYPGEIEGYIKDIQEDLPKLYSYIRWLENINQGVYCTNCDAVKNVPIEEEIRKTVDTPAKRVTFDDIEFIEGSLVNGEHKQQSERSSFFLREPLNPRELIIDPHNVGKDMDDVLEKMLMERLGGGGISESESNYQNNYQNNYLGPSMQPLEADISAEEEVDLDDIVNKAAESFRSKNKWFEL